MHRILRRLVLPGLLLSSLTACDRLGIPDPAKEAAEREAEGRAIGSACRQSGRAMEDCFTLNQKASKAAIFNGWREMNDYMMQNKIEAVKPEYPVPGQLVTKRNKDNEHADAETASEPSEEASGSAAERRRARIAERRKRTSDGSEEAAKPADKEKAAH